MHPIITPEQNQLLAALTSSTQRRLFPKLKRVDLCAGSVLVESGLPLQHAYFPADCIIDVVNMSPEGATTATAMVGNEGMLGVNLVLGETTMVGIPVTQHGGSAFQLAKTDLVALFAEKCDLRKQLLGYLQVLMEQIAETSHFNSRYRIDQQLCRWILLSLERLSTNTLPMTQEAIAHYLGVRRESISEALTKLQRLGAIRHQRGKITVLDPEMLKKLSGH